MTKPEQAVPHKTDLDGGSTTAQQLILTVSSMVVNTAKRTLLLVNSMMVSYGTLGHKTNGKPSSEHKWPLVKIREPCFPSAMVAQSTLTMVPSTITTTKVNTTTHTTKHHNFSQHSFGLTINFTRTSKSLFCEIETALYVNLGELLFIQQWILFSYIQC